MDSIREVWWRAKQIHVPYQFFKEQKSEREENIPKVNPKNQVLCERSHSYILNTLVVISRNSLKKALT
jgi:hypothetical protein